MAYQLPAWIRRFMRIPDVVAPAIKPEALAVPPSHLVINGEPVPVEGVGIRTWVDHDDVVRYHGRRRAATDVSELVVHESVTTSRAATVETFRRRSAKLGYELAVHLIIDADGSVTQHGDLGTARLIHARGHNGPSVGLEVVNPYYPKHRPRSGPWAPAIDAPWAHGGRYVVPTRAQAESAALIIGAITGAEGIGLRIPREWVGYQHNRGQRLRMGLLPNGDERSGGIWAHHYSAHADGAWPVLYAWLRLEAGLDPDAAYDEAVKRATGVRGWIDLSDYAAEVG